MIVSQLLIIQTNIFTIKVWVTKLFFSPLYQMLKGIIQDEGSYDSSELFVRSMTLTRRQLLRKNENKN